MLKPGVGIGAVLKLLGTETGPAVVGADDGADGGHGDWPIDANGSPLVTELAK